MESIIVALAAGVVALLFAAFTAFRVIKADPGNEAHAAPSGTPSVPGLPPFCAGNT